MMCEQREPDILLLAHRELPLGRAVALHMHLSRCSQCRERYRQLAGVSVQLASVLRTPGTPAWVPADASLSLKEVLASLSKRHILILCALVGVSALMMYGVVHILSQRQQETGQSKTVSDPGCSPGLPNDQCR